MARFAFTVWHLANEAHIDTDEALIRLWDGGIGYINGPTSVIRRRDRKTARRLIGLATVRELASKSAWQSLFELEDDDFRQLLESLNIRVPNSRKLPKSAINKLRVYANDMGRSWPQVNGFKSGATTKDVPKSSHTLAVPPILAWKSFGQERNNIKYLTGDDVRTIHHELVVEFDSGTDPIDPPGVRDENLLESALSRPHTSMGQTKKYPSVEMAAAALLHSLIHNHAFHNGNKRTALVSMLAFLDSNRLLVTCHEDELFKFVLRIAQHSIVPSGQSKLPDREVQFIAEWIYKESRRIELGERVISFRRLHKLLTGYDCTYSPPKGNQIFISRTIKKKSMFRKVRESTLTTQTSYGDQGRDIDKISIAKIRKDLHIDETHGIDSASFYGNAPAAAGEFIIKFRKTLRRLAKL